MLDTFILVLSYIFTSHCQSIKHLSWEINSLMFSKQSTYKKYDIHELTTTIENRLAISCTLEIQLFLLGCVNIDRYFVLFIHWFLDKIAIPLNSHNYLKYRGGGVWIGDVEQNLRINFCLVFTFSEPHYSLKTSYIKNTHYWLLCWWYICELPIKKSGID